MPLGGVLGHYDTPGSKQRKLSQTIIILFFADWRCYDDKQKLLDDLYSSTCDLAAAGMAPLPDRIEKGLRFSVPSIRSGFSIMVSKIVEPPGMWYFFGAMSWEVWVLMIGTGKYYYFLGKKKNC